MAELLLRVQEKDIYPLAELTKLEKADISSILSLAIKDWIQNEIIKLYHQGNVTISKASEILGISVWEMIDLLKTRNVPLQIGRTEIESSS